MQHAYIPTEGDVEHFAACIVDELVALAQAHTKAPVVCVQDGAIDLDAVVGTNASNSFVAGLREQAVASAAAPIVNRSR